MPVPYCTDIDVVRKFNPQLGEAALEANDYIGNEDREQIRARIDAVSDQFDESTGRAMREVRVGSPGSPRTYEYYDAQRQRHRYPLEIDLDHEDIVPIDPGAGDTLEVRDGRDSWDDITAGEGDDWFLDYDDGELKIFELLVNRIYFEARNERYLRATYRHGALGGGRRRGGQTTLASQIDDSATSLSVADSARLPADGGVMLVGTGTDAEYVRVTDVDTSTDTLTVARGIRATSAASHASGDTVHYCPLEVRDAVAAKTARELLRYEDWVDELIEAGNGLGASDKMDAWEQSWTDACANHSAVHRM
ncbi:hypothetical protein EGH21_22570 [Halomicroarcula sp. F13]|uniref:Uncharacterized protein n=1 Tax=Haloarcula rubra TaxID=2487747 RepID=A0AAW4PXA4_9EURY|nr:hypothetical protein [Halomicroarcula rubra]MBX0325806.1 hypothetical protein [Halomicroarcula rubra]